MEFVAEIGASHNGRLETVLKLMDQTVQADAFKIQTWCEEMSVPYQIQSGAWSGWDAQKLYRKAKLPWEWHQEIFDHGRRLGVQVFSSPFDRASVDFLERLGCPRYKVASFELVDLPLVKYIAETGKPMIWSLGQITDAELTTLIKHIAPINPMITLLHCVSEYPTNLGRAGLWRLDEIRERGYPVGISDHSSGVDLGKGTTGTHSVPIVASALGVDMIEKHITMGRNGLDGGFALRPDQFNRMVLCAKVAQRVIGDPRGADYPSFELRRSLYYDRPLKAGTVLQMRHLKTARPNKGMCPLQIEKIPGKVLAEDVVENDPVLPSQFVG